MVWYGLVWLSMVRISFRQHPSEAFVKVSLRSDFFLAVLEKILFWFGLVKYGKVWFCLV